MVPVWLLGPGIPGPSHATSWSKYHKLIYYAKNYSHFAFYLTTAWPYTYLDMKMKKKNIVLATLSEMGCLF